MSEAAGKALLGALMGIVVIALLMFVVRCPCERILVPCCLGLMEKAVSDWSFANSRSCAKYRCRASFWSVNLNCMADDAGALYLAARAVKENIGLVGQWPIPTPELCWPSVSGATESFTGR